MRLIIGGAASGKLDRVHELGYLDEDIFDCSTNNIADSEDIANSKVLYKLNCLIDGLMKQSIEPKREIFRMLLQSNIEVIVCDEVGCGVVPMERYERNYREAVGRICCGLAAQASIVERVYCGIATVLKSDEN